MNIIEELRGQVIDGLFKTNSFKTAWDLAWKKEIKPFLDANNSRRLIDLGDSLSSIFLSTRSVNPEQRGQSAVSAAGSAWECLIVWYINICCVGSRVVAIKKMSHLPNPLRAAIQVNYSNSQTNSESDIIIVVFPNRREYNEEIKQIDFENLEPIKVKPFVGERIANSRITKILDKLCQWNFSEYELGVIQCKTNWNENAQVPMLWDMIYQTNGFRSNNISIGNDGYSIKDLSNFTYSFATVPTQAMENFSATSTPVLRVRNLTGGNYWGFPTKNNVAFSIKEIFNRNFQNGFSPNVHSSLNTNLKNIDRENLFQI